MGCPTSPFIATRGGRAFTCVNIAIFSWYAGELRHRCCGDWSPRPDDSGSGMVIPVGDEPSPLWIVAIPSEALCSVLHQYNSNHLGMVIVVWVNTSNSFPCRVVPTVTRVRCYRDESCWNSVHRVLPQYGRKHGRRRINGTIAVREKPGAEAEARARRWVHSRLGLGRGVGCAKGQGSSMSLVVLEARARASRWLRSRQGLGRVAYCARGQGTGVADCAWSRDSSLIAYPRGGEFL